MCEDTVFEDISFSTQNPKEKIFFLKGPGQIRAKTVRENWLNTN